MRPLLLPALLILAACGSGGGSDADRTNVSDLGGDPVYQPLDEPTLPDNAAENATEAPENATGNEAAPDEGSDAGQAENGSEKAAD